MIVLSREAQTASARKQYLERKSRGGFQSFLEANNIRRMRMRNRWSSVVVTLLAGICLLATTLQGAEVRKPKKMVQPKYPEIALKMRVDGTVKLEAVVGQDGAVNKVIFVSGPALLKDEAVECVKQWQYEPGSGTTLVPIDVNFRLPN
jgi:TonB family protein